MTVKLLVERGMGIEKICHFLMHEIYSVGRAMYRPV